MNPTPPTPEKVCKTCGGSGAIDTISKEDGRDSYRKCSSCYGTGQEPTPLHDIEGGELDKILGRHSKLWNYSKAETYDKLSYLIAQAKAEGYREGQNSAAKEPLMIIAAILKQEGGYYKIFDRNLIALDSNVTVHAWDDLDGKALKLSDQLHKGEHE